MKRKEINEQRNWVSCVGVKTTTVCRYDGNTHGSQWTKLGGKQKRRANTRRKVKTETFRNSLSPDP